MSSAYKISLTMAIFLTLIYAFQRYYPDFMALFSNVFAPFIAGAAVLSCVFLLKRYWHKTIDKFSIIWVCFAVGLIFWFIGELVWTAYTLLLGVEVPFPSIADAFWLIGYIPVFLALYFYVKLFGAVLSKKIIASSFAITAALTIIVSVTLIISIIEAEADLLASLVGLAYPFFDLGLFSVALLGHLIFLKGGLGKSWLLLTGATLLDVVADLLFCYTTTQEIYYNGHPLELLYHFSYLLYLLAFYVHSKEL